MNVVRLSVAPGFGFTPSAKYIDAGQAPRYGYDEPPGDYVTVRTRQKMTMFQGDGRHART